MLLVKLVFFYVIVYCVVIIDFGFIVSFEFFMGRISSIVG